MTTTKTEETATLAHTNTTTTQITDGIYRISTAVGDDVLPGGLYV